MCRFATETVVLKLFSFYLIVSNLLQEIHGLLYVQKTIS